MSRLVLLSALMGAAFLVWLKFGPPPGVILLPPVMRSPCESAKTWTLGTVDPRFNLGPGELMAELEEAAAIWNATQRKMLLAHDPDGVIRIDFSYDERQALVTQVGAYQDQLQARQALVAPEIERLKVEVPEFNAKHSALVARIKDWNAKGGAPPEEAAKLRREQEELEVQRRRLDRLTDYARSDSEALKAQAKVFNEAVDQFNDALHGRPEQGLYETSKKRITLFFGQNRKELVHTMAHEFGHALGILHTGDPAGIMHPKTSESLTLSGDDRAALAAVCRQKLPD